MGSQNFWNWIRCVDCAANTSQFFQDALRWCLHCCFFCNVKLSLSAEEFVHQGVFQSSAPDSRTQASQIRPDILLPPKSERCRSSWITHEFCCWVLYQWGWDSIPLACFPVHPRWWMRRKCRKEESREKSQLWLNWSQNVFFTCLNLQRGHKLKQPPFSSEGMMYGSSTQNTPLTKEPRAEYTSVRSARREKNSFYVPSTCSG